MDKLVIFDCDGVLVDSEIISNRIDAEALTSFRYEISTEESIRRFTGLNAKTVRQIILEESGKDIPLDFLISQQPKFFSDGKYQRIVHQVWDWHDDRHYTMHLYITYETSKGWISHHFIGNYRAIAQNEVASLVKSAGFEEVKILTPEETGYYQPIIQGRNP